MTLKNDQPVLMVDDEPNILSAYRRTIGQKYALTCAKSGPEALSLMDAGKTFAVVISDMRMPEMNGVDFIVHAAQKHKDTVYMMLTGNADQQTAVEAINNGHVFRFLNKPATPEHVEIAIEAGLRQYALVTAERVLLHDTVCGSVKLLIDAISMAHPLLFALQTQVKTLHLNVTSQIGLGDRWNVALAGSLALLGLTTLPEASTRTPVSDETLSLASANAARLLRHIPRLGSVAEMIARQREPGALPADLTFKDPQDVVTAGARVLRACVDVVRGEMEVQSRAAVLDEMAGRETHDPRLIEALRNTAPSEPMEVPLQGAVEISVDDLKPGMVLRQSIMRGRSVLLPADGRSLNDFEVAALKSFAVSSDVSQRVWVTREAA